MALDAIREISDSFAPLRERRAQAFPAGSAGRRRNLPLFHFATETLEYEDKALVKELMHGAPVVGSIASTNVLAERVRPAQSTQQELLNNLPAMNRVIRDRVIRSQGSVLANE